MNSIELCASIGNSLPALFECSAAPREGVRVRTPLMYPDGGIVDVFVLERHGSVHGHGFRRCLGLAANAIGQRPAFPEAASPDR